MTSTYGYDSYSRLTSAVVGSTTYGYTYDVAGNRVTSSKTAASTVNYGIDNANQLCWSGTATGTNRTTTCPSTPTGDSASTYDTAGSTTASAGTGFTNNNHGQTTAIGSTGFTYADADQTERTGVTTGGNTTTYLNGLFGVSGYTTSSPASSVFITRDPSGTPISLRVGAGSGSTNSYYLTDQQSSVLRLTDATGNTDTAAYTYDPYGATLTATGTQVTVNPLRYATSIYDPSTSLYKLGARYYNPTTGPWTTTDSATFAINNPTSLNTYTYAGDNPVGNIDPSGASVLGDCASGAVDGAEGGAEAAVITGGGVVGGAIGGAAGGCGSALAVDVTDSLFGSDATTLVSDAFKIKGAYGQVKTLAKGTKNLLSDIS